MVWWSIDEEENAGVVAGPLQLLFESRLCPDEHSQAALEFGVRADSSPCHPCLVENCSAREPWSP